jgi:hypothetical protein
MAAMVTPVMHPLKVRVHHWYVPLRLIWEDFENFITGGEDGLDTSVPPYMQVGSSTTFAAGTNADYMGLPVDGVKVPPKFSSLPFRAYNLIFNEWYRDQDLEDAIPMTLASGLDSTTSRNIRSVDWERDYFTTARPWPQKGAAVTVPITGGGTTPGTIVPDPANPSPTFRSHMTYNTSQYYSNPAPLGAHVRGEYDTFTDGYVSAATPSFTDYGGHHGTLEWVNPNLTISGGGTIGSMDINALREAFALQKFEEHRAMYGSRYTEYLRYLGVKASDSRLQRPEYLGGGSSTIQFSEVLQSAAMGDSPIGSLRGHGIGAMRSNRFRRFIEEHGFVLTLLSAVPKAIYMQGVHRLWQRQTKEDFWQKELEHIGQQEVYTDELYGAYNEDGSRKVFGYQNRYDE